EAASALNHFGYAINADDSLLQLYVRCINSWHDNPLELQSAGTCAVGNCFHTAVIKVASPVKDNPGDPFFPRSLRDELAHSPRPLALRAGTSRLFQRRSRCERVACLVVDELHMDVGAASEHVQPRPLRRAV